MRLSAEPEIVVDVPRICPEGFEGNLTLNQILFGAPSMNSLGIGKNLIFLPDILYL